MVAKMTKVGARISAVRARMSDDPAGGDHLVQRHRQVLAIACAVGVLAFALQELPDGRVAVRGFPWVPLPHTLRFAILARAQVPRLRLDPIDHPPG